MNQIRRLINGLKRICLASWRWQNRHRQFRIGRGHKQTIRTVQIVPSRDWSAWKDVEKALGFNISIWCHNTYIFCRGIVERVESVTTLEQALDWDWDPETDQGGAKIARNLGGLVHYLGDYGIADESIKQMLKQASVDGDNNPDGPDWTSPALEAIIDSMIQTARQEAEELVEQFAAEVNPELVILTGMIPATIVNPTQVLRVFFDAGWRSNGGYGAFWEAFGVKVDYDSGIRNLLFRMEGFGLTRDTISRMAVVTAVSQPTRPT